MLLGKKNVTQQGLKASQGSEVQLTMMLHSLCKECSVLLCEAVQGDNHVYFTLCLILLMWFMLYSKN